MVIAGLDERRARFIADAIDAQLRRLRADGVRPPADLLALVTALRSSAVQRGSIVDDGHGLGDGAPMTRLAVNYDDAADLLGVSRSGVKRLVTSGVLPVVDIAGCPRVRMSDLVDYLQRREPRQLVRTSESS